eukprot:1054570-Rhodomonas_salina.1
MSLAPTSARADPTSSTASRSASGLHRSASIHTGSAAINADNASISGGAASVSGGNAAVLLALLTLALLTEAMLTFSWWPAQEGGVGVIVYFRKEGRSLGEVTKFLVYNARSVNYVPQRILDASASPSVPVLTCGYVVLPHASSHLWICAARDD